MPVPLLPAFSQETGPDFQVKVGAQPPGLRRMGCVFLHSEHRPLYSLTLLSILEATDAKSKNSVER